MEELKIGTTVQLKSGGPLMTIESIESRRGVADCVWFSDKELKRAEFYLHTLTLSS